MVCTKEFHKTLWRCWSILLDQVVGEVFFTVKSLQGKKTIVSEQNAAFSQLKEKLFCFIGLKRAEGEELIQAAEVEVKGWCVVLNDVENYVKEQGLSVEDCLASMTANELVEVCKAFRLLLYGLVGRIEQLCLNVYDLEKNPASDTTRSCENKKIGLHEPTQRLEAEGWDS